MTTGPDRSRQNSTAGSRGAGVTEVHTLLVLGATGDLAGRLLLPGAAALLAAGALPADFRLIGAGEQAWSKDSYVAHARRRLAQHAAELTEDQREELLSRLDYRQVDVRDGDSVAGVLTAFDEAIAIYLALPTQVLRPALDAVTAAALPPGSRVAIEKPFGQDAASAADLNELLLRLGHARAAFRVDHILGMQVVRELPRRLTADPRWGVDRIDEVEIVWEETLALEGRAAFYDRAGALRDLVQNHLLQILCVLASQQPGLPVIEARSAERAAVMRSVRPLSPEDVVTRTRRARYTAGRLADTAREVPDYIAEAGVDPRRDTETFAEVILRLDSPEWSGTRFVLRAGKALGRLRRGVLLRFASGEPLWIDADAPIAGAADGVSAEAGAYVEVLRDLLSGTGNLSVAQDESELAWQIFTPVLQAWAAGTVPLLEYPAGSAGRE